MPQAAKKTEHLRILATSDVHMHVLSFDYLNDVPSEGQSLSALFETIEDLRRAAAAETPQRHSLLFDNGDMLQGSALADHLGAPCSMANGDRGDPGDFAHVLDNMGYDALGLGNHDLDFGLHYLAEVATQATAPVVSSNLVLKEPQNWLQKYVVLECGAVRVGVVSVLPPRTVDWSFAIIGDAIGVQDMVSACREAAQEARQAGADLVVALAHTGLGRDLAENALTALAEDGAMDCLIGGHTHRVFPPFEDRDIEGADLAHGLLFGVAMVMPGFGAALAGCIDLDLYQSEDGAWHVENASGCVVPAKRTAKQDSPAFHPIQKAHEATRERLNTKLGHTHTALTSYFVQFAPSGMLSLCASAQAKVIDALRQDLPERDLPLLSVVSPPRAGGRGGPWNYTDIPAGDILARHVAQLDVFTNRVWAVRSNGTDLKNWLEKSACCFAAHSDDPQSGLLDPDIPAFDFDVVYGLSYDIDPFAPKGARVSNIMYEGRAIDEGQEFLLALNSYRACGGSQFPNMCPEAPIMRPNVTTKDAVSSWIASGETSLFEPPWQFAKAVAGTHTWIETGPSAIGHLAEIAHLSPGTPQLQNSGFLRIPIRL